MASLPNPNPIDAGHMHRGGCVDHLGNSTIHCWACDSEQRVELYKMILGRHFGFGAPIYVKPFQKHSSTRGKVGRKGTYALCCNCGSLLAQDDGARRSLEANDFSPKGIMSEQAGYQLINRIVDDPEYPESEPASAGLPPTSRVRKLDAEVSPEPEAQEAEIVEPPEVTEVRQVEPEPTELAVNDDPEVTKPSRDEGRRNMGSGERMETVVDEVDDDPEVVRLREALDAAEREVEQRLEQRLEERRQAVEADLLKAETAKRVSELARKLEEVEAKLAQLDDPDWTPSTATPSAVTMKLHRKTCRCGSVVDMPAAHCATCLAHIANQLFAPSSYLCGNCSQMATESSESCSNCEAVFQE